MGTTLSGAVERRVGISCGGKHSDLVELAVSQVDDLVLGLPSVLSRHPEAGVPDERVRSRPKHRKQKLHIRQRDRPRLGGA